MKLNALAPLNPHLEFASEDVIVRCFLSHRAIAVLASIAFGLCASNQSHAEIVTVLDSFTATEGGNPDKVTVAGDGFSVVFFPISPTVSDPIGSFRELRVNQSVVGQLAEMQVGGGAADLTSSSAANSLWQIAYGTTAPLNLNATQNGSDSFKLSFAASSAGLEYQIKVTSATGSGVSNGNAFSSIGSAAEYAAFSSFSNSANINFANLESIEILFRDSLSSSGGSAKVTQFAAVAVPEPSSIIFGGGMAAAAFVRFRRRRVNLRHQHAV